MCQSKRDSEEKKGWHNPKLAEYDNHILHFMSLRKLTLARILSTLVVGKIVKPLTIKRIKFWWHTVSKSKENKKLESSSSYYRIFDFFAKNHNLILLDSEISDIIQLIEKERAEYEGE